MPQTQSIVYTVRGLCSICYTCVRECPAKAIKISQGQAEVIPERCIACGTCTKVCSQGAKRFLKYHSEMEALLATDGKRKIAILDPSFPAEFNHMEPENLAGMLQAIGFDLVLDGACGGDLVAREYKRIYDTYGEPTIASNCYAVVKYIEKYHPKLVPSLAPVVSPMVAAARIARQVYGVDSLLVFIGPCIAKKQEPSELDLVITYKELRKYFRDRDVNYKNTPTAEFSPPYGGKGGISVLRRGMLKAIGIDDNLLTGNVMSANGRVDFREAIKEFESSALSGYHLDLLGCKGCVKGPGMSDRRRQFTGIIEVSEYVRGKLNGLHATQIADETALFSDINLTTSFAADDRRLPLPTKCEIKKKLSTIGKTNRRNFLNCGACGYATCIEYSIAIIEGLAEEEMCLPNSIEKLHTSIEELAVKNKDLASMKETLKQAEKLANMGQLSAGIAHELNNPLGVVIMYSNILLEETSKDTETYADLKLITEQAERCKRIVGGLLNFARKNRVKLGETSIRDLINSSLASLIVPEGVTIEQHYDTIADMQIEVDCEQMTQVLNNLVKNAIEAIAGKGSISISATDTAAKVTIEISDTGCGIPADKLQKIFEPFYTTKEIGKGTGLGLATTYGIVKMHNGQITVRSNTDAQKGQTGTTFTIVLPRQSI